MSYVEQEILALLQECDQCGGSGHMEAKLPGVEFLCLTCVGCCPSCSGRGSVVSDQAVKAGAKAVDAFEVFVAGDGQNAIRPRSETDIARAVLAAAIFGEET